MAHFLLGAERDVPQRTPASLRSKRTPRGAVVLPATEPENPSTVRHRHPPAPPAARLELDGGPMDLRVEALTLEHPLTLRAAGAMVVFPLRTAVLELEVLGEHLLLDGTHLGVVPSGSRSILRGRSPGGRVLLATAHPPLLAAAIAQYESLGLEAARFQRWLERPQRLPRTVWVSEVVQRYLFERQACARHDNDATRFLEVELVKEVYFLLRDRDDGADRASLVQKRSVPVQRALAYVEAHLFEAPSVAALARAAGASDSTLLRAFRREVGCSPSAYWRMLRLDEAMVLLESGRYNVAEVALRIGYDNASAFTHAFQRRFGRAPSELVPR